MKHGFRQTDIACLKVFGPELITQLKFSQHPTNNMFYQLEKWPEDMSAKDTKQALVDMGLTMYLIDNEGNVLKEESYDHSVVKDVQQS